jgi:hypothetical protein
MQGEELLPTPNLGLESLYQEASNALIAEQKFRRNNYRIRQLATAVVGLLSVNVLAGIEIATDDQHKAVAMETNTSTTTQPEISVTTEAPTTTATVTTTTLPPPPSTIPSAELHAAMVDSKLPSRGAIGADQSWPNCPIPIRPDVTFGIVGVNDGVPFETNRCLTELVAKFQKMGIKPGLYVNTSLDMVLANAQNDSAVPCPWVGTPEEQGLCPAYRWGYRSGQDSVKKAWDLGVSSREWYIDVETQNRWSGNYDQNRVSILGTMDAVRNEAGKNEGVAPGEIYEAVYSNVHFWQKITYNMKLPGIHAWYATGVPEERVLGFCDDPKYNFTGGGVILVQTVDTSNHGGAIDINIRC